MKNFLNINLIIFILAAFQYVKAQCPVGFEDVARQVSERANIPRRDVDRMLNSFSPEELVQIRRQFVAYNGSKLAKEARKRALIGRSTANMRDVKDIEGFIPNRTFRIANQDGVDQLYNIRFSVDEMESLRRPQDIREKVFSALKMGWRNGDVRTGVKRIGDGKWEIKIASSDTRVALCRYGKTFRVYDVTNHAGIKKFGKSGACR